MGFGGLFDARNSAITAASLPLRVPVDNCELRCAQLVPEPGGDAATMKLLANFFSTAPRDLQEKNRADELYGKNMENLQIAYYPRILVFLHQNKALLTGFALGFASAPRPLSIAKTDGW